MLVAWEKETTDKTGTWIPLQDGKDLAVKNHVFDKLKPIFEYVPGDRSPPPAPKHATAASTKPRAPKAAASTARKPVPAYGQMQAEYDHGDTMMRDEETPDNITVVSESAYEDYDNPYYTNSRKRKRMEDSMSQADKEHRLWAEELLDYFMLQDSAEDAMPYPPPPPANANLNRPIDDKGYTALHWAAAIGDVDVVKDLIRKGASIDAQAKNGETPLMRAVIFTNSFDKQNMERLAGLLIRTVNMQEWTGATVFHHIANTTLRKSKYQCARYYLDCLLNKMSEFLAPDAIEGIVNCPDQNGDTAITIAARHGARKCVRSLIGRNAAVDIPNNAGETADQLIVQLNHRRQERSSYRQPSSSPFQSDGYHTLGGAVQAPDTRNGGIHPSLNGSTAAVNGTASDVYKSEGALALTSHVFPAIFSKGKELAANIDAEIAEKDAEVAEAKRVLAMREAEAAALKKQQEDLQAKELEQTGGGAQNDEELEVELRSLEQEVQDLVETEQATALKEELTRETTKLSSTPDGKQDLDNTETKARISFDLSRRILEAKRDRVKWTQQIVQNMSLAGLGDKQDDYRRLIGGALNLEEDQIAEVLPEIVLELEESRGLESVGA